MKVSMLTGDNFEEFGLAFAATVRRNNSLIGIVLDCLFRPDAVGNYNESWNNRE